MSRSSFHQPDAAAAAAAAVAAAAAASHVKFAQSSSDKDKEEDDEQSQSTCDSSTTNTTTISRELRPLRAGLLGRRLSWMTVSTGNMNINNNNNYNNNNNGNGMMAEQLLAIARHDPYVADKFKLLLIPPEFDRDDLLCSAHSFLSSLVEFIPSAKLDPTFEVFKSIRSLVKSPSCIRLFGLLLHYQYWNVIYPAAKNAINQVKKCFEEEREAIRQREMMRLQQEQLRGMRKAAAAKSMAVPAILEDNSNVFQSVEFNDFEDIENRMKLPQAIMDIDQREVKLSRGDSMGPIGNTSNPALLSRSSESENISHDGMRTSKSAPSINDIDRIFNQEVQMSSDASEASIQDDDCAKQAIDELFTNGSQFDFSSNSTITEASLSASEKEQLYIQLEVCIVGLFEKMGRNKFALVTGRQAFISCAHYVVDEILAMVYPWFAAVPESPKKNHQFGEDDSTLSDETQYTMLYTALRDVNVRLRRYVHQSISDLIDPTRSYTSILLLNAVLGLGTIKNFSDVAKKTKALQRHDQKVTGKGKYYRTSTAILAIFGDSQSFQTRKFLQRSGALYTNVPGAVIPFEAKIDRLQGLVTTDSPIEPQPISRIASRPSTASRISSAASTTRSRSTSPLKDKQRGESKLDFNKLFVDQPNVNYFPSGIYGDNVNILAKDKIFLDPHDSEDVQMDRINNIVNTAAGLGKHLKRYSRRDYLDKYVPEIHKARFQSTTVMLAPDNTVLATQSRQKLSFNEEKRQLKDINTLGTTAKPVTIANNASTKRATLANNGGKLVSGNRYRNMEEQSQSGDSVQSSIDSMTLIHNKAAEIPISLKAKTALMNLMVEKTSKTYIYDTQTDLTALRIALIKGGNCDTQEDVKRSKSIKK